MSLERRRSKLAKLKVLGKEGTDVSVDANNKKRSVARFSSKIQGDISEVHAKTAASVNAVASVLLSPPSTETGSDRHQSLSIPPPT